MPTVSATAPATATRRPPSPILTHRLRWRIAAHLVGDEVFTFGRPRGLQGLRINVDLVLRRSVLTLKLWKC